MNKTTAMFVLHLREHLTKEPPAPDPQQHTGTMLEQVARRYDEWERTANAIRLLLGVRLVQEALDGELTDYREVATVPDRFPS